MAHLKTLDGASNIVTVRTDMGATTGTVRIEYDKYEAQEIWIRNDNGAWVHVTDVENLGPGEHSDNGGRYTLTISPGEIYEVGIFEPEAGPPDPQQVAGLKIFGINKQPGPIKLVEGHSEEAGGTFVSQFIETSKRTSVAAIGCKRGSFDLGADGFPVFDETIEAVTWQDHHPSAGHNMLLMPLMAGNDYECRAVVVDEFGNWDVMVSGFRTESRKILIRFTTLHVYNDSDPGAEGEADFNFAVNFGTPPGPVDLIEEFTKSIDPLDNFGKTDRPYHLGFAHVGDYVTVNDGQVDVYVRSTGVEDDGPFDSDEGAWSRGGRIVFPVGFNEDAMGSFRLDAPPSTNGSDFHYGVDVVWVVDYEPRP